MSDYRDGYVQAICELFILFCRDPQFRRALYKLDPCVVPQVH